MRKKRIKRYNGQPVDGAAPVRCPSLESLAAVLEQIAGMDALPLAPSPRQRKGKRRGAT
jgi:hypothetical protein